MRYRKITHTDIPSLFQVRTSTRENCVTLLELEAIGVTPGSISAALDGDLSGWIGEQQSKAVGFILADFRTAEIVVLAVISEFEGKGIGRELLSLIESEMIQVGITEAWLWAGVDTAIRSHGFYRRLGWCPTGETHKLDEKLVKKFR